MCQQKTLVKQMDDSQSSRERKQQLSMCAEYLQKLRQEAHCARITFQEVRPFINTHPENTSGVHIPAGMSTLWKHNKHANQLQKGSGALSISTHPLPLSLVLDGSMVGATRRSRWPHPAMRPAAPRHPRAYAAKTFAHVVALHQDAAGGRPRGWSNSILTQTLRPPDS